MTFIKRPDVKQQYPIAIYPGDEQTAFSVFFPDIPGCFSAGDSLNDVLKNANEALALHLEGLSEIPTATRIDEHVNKPEYKGCFWCMTEYMKLNVIKLRYSISLDIYTKKIMSLFGLFMPFYGYKKKHNQLIYNE